MSIRIVPKDEVNKAAGVIPPLLFPNLKKLYAKRAERLQKLAETHPLADYLLFVSTIVEAQHQVILQHPLPADSMAILLQDTRQDKRQHEAQEQAQQQAQQQASAPLDVHQLSRSAHWQTLFRALLAEVRRTAPKQINRVLDALESYTAAELETLSGALLRGEYAQVESGQAVFLWSALSMYWVQMAAQIPGKAKAEYGEQRQFCPVCSSSPVASVVHIGSNSGLRYLHCGLCESEWHVVRIKCSNCEQSGLLDYWSLDSEQAAVKAESCGDCGSYLKILYQEKEPNLDVIADDLASLILDANMEEEGFARSSVNPFLFPGE